MDSISILRKKQRINTKNLYIVYRIFRNLELYRRSDRYFFFQLLKSRFPDLSDLYAMLRYIIRGIYIDTQKGTKKRYEEYLEIYIYIYN